MRCCRIVPKSHSRFEIPRSQRACSSTSANAEVVSETVSTPALYRSGGYTSDPDYGTAAWNYQHHSEIELQQALNTIANAAKEIDNLLDPGSTDCIEKGSAASCTLAAAGVIPFGGLGKDGAIDAAKAGEGLLGDSWKSRKIFGHAFTEHGAGAKNLRSLTDRARSRGPQGQWLDNDAAAGFLNTVFGQKLNGGAFGVRIPSGLGRVILPDGLIVDAPFAYIIPNRDGMIRTAYPTLGAGLD